MVRTNTDQLFRFEDEDEDFDDEMWKTKADMELLLSQCKDVCEKLGHVVEKQGSQKSGVRRKQKLSSDGHD